MDQKTLDIIRNIDWGVVTGLIALFTALAGLYLQRTHDKLSVKPIGMITFRDYIDNIAVSLQNKGIGPLIIKDISVTDESGRKEESIIAFFGQEFVNVIWSDYIGDITDWAILPGESKTLIEYGGDPNDREFDNNRERVRRILAQLQIEVQYQDVYEKSMPTIERNLDWFRRVR